MQIITLLSDWGEKDYYVSIVKGKIYEKIPEVTILDICHQVKKFDIIQAAFILKNTYSFFPQGTIHIVGVNDIASPKMPHIVVKANNHYFIGADNGIFSLLFENEDCQVWEIKVYQESNVYTFPSKDLFPKVAALLIQKEPMENIGYPSHLQKKITPTQPAFTYNKNEEGEIIGGSIKGQVIYIDDYGNVLTNITESIFREYASRFGHFQIKTRPSASGPDEVIKIISKAYQDVREAELCALFLENHHLEISLNQGHAASLMGFEIGSPVTVLFKV
ncbi:MAG: SAM-dependent chlorinase/fluorinase [Bacteroidales bacterium]